MSQVMVRPVSHITSGSVEPWLNTRDFFKFADDNQADGAASKVLAGNHFVLDSSVLLANHFSLMLQSLMHNVYGTQRELIIQNSFSRLEAIVADLERQTLTVNTDLDALAERALESLRGRQNEDLDQWASGLVHRSSALND